MERDAEVDVGRDGAPTGRPVTPAVWLAAAIVSVVIVALIEAARWSRGPLPDEVLRGARVGVGHVGAGWVGPACAVGAGLLAAIVVGLVPWLRQQARAFGVLAAGGLAGAVAATGGVLGVGAVAGLGGDEARAAVAGAAVLVAILLSPLLRDRGVLSLTLVSLCIGGVVVAGRRQALDEVRASEVFAADRDALLGAGLERLVVAVPEEWPLARRQALTCSVRPPWLETGLDVLMVDAGSAEERAFVAQGWRGVRLGGDDGPEEFGGGVPEEVAFPHKVTVRWLEDRGPVAVPHPPAGTFVLHVVTPVGVLRQRGEDPTRGLRLLGETWDAFGAMTAPLGDGVGAWVAVSLEGVPGFTAWVRVASG